MLKFALAFITFSQIVYETSRSAGLLDWDERYMPSEYLQNIKNKAKVSFLNFSENSLLLITKDLTFSQIIARLAGQQVYQIGMKGLLLSIIYFVIDWKLVSKKSYFGHLMKICSKGRYFLRSIHLMYHENSQKSNLERAEIVFEHF